MDDKWFKAQQKKAGVTAEDIANAIGRDRSVVSRIYVGRQKMTMDQAHAFSKVLDVPLEIVMEKAGMGDSAATKTIASYRDQKGFSESDASPFHAAPSAMQAAEIIATAFGKRSGADVWTIDSNAMHLSGYLRGDKILVDTHQSERVTAGDIVIAQIYNWQDGDAKTILRRYEPPVLVADSIEENDRRVVVVDGNNVVIKGKVIAQWRN